MPHWVIKHHSLSLGFHKYIGLQVSVALFLPFSPEGPNVGEFQHVKFKEPPLLVFHSSCNFIYIPTVTLNTLSNVSPIRLLTLTYEV